MNFPGAPRAFDATDGSRRRLPRPAADIGVACAAVGLEVIALAMIFGRWLLSGLNLDPDKTLPADSLWGYLIAAGGVAVLAIVAVAIAVGVRAIVTAVSQGVMAGLICLIVLVGAVGQAHEDALCRDIPARSGCQG